MNKLLGLSSIIILSVLTCELIRDSCYKKNQNKVVESKGRIITFVIDNKIQEDIFSIEDDYYRKFFIDRFNHIIYTLSVYYDIKEEDYYIQDLSSIVSSVTGIKICEEIKNNMKD